MSDPLPRTYTSFDGNCRIATGSLHENALAAREAIELGATGPVLIFDDATGRTVDVDLRNAIEAMTAEVSRDEPRGRGRPKLGVVAREVTLLPRHWEWLAGQPGGASVALRKLVEDARRASGDKDRLRNAQERAYHFMTAIAGDFPGFEEATRALFANEPTRFDQLTRPWPADVREHAARLAFG
jgi:hypothetical protein